MLLLIYIILCAYSLMFYIDVVAIYAHFGFLVKCGGNLCPFWCFLVKCVCSACIKSLSAKYQTDALFVDRVINHWLYV
jgi:hypothetical protein